jgi:hypothetical protein
MDDLLRELDHRSGDGIDVWLLWRPRDDHIFVAVADERTDACFTIEVREGERPLDVFRHPYAYEDWRSIDRSKRRARSRLSGS